MTTAAQAGSANKTMDSNKAGKYEEQVQKPDVKQATRSALTDTGKHHRLVYDRPIFRVKKHDPF